jgi:8-oxo-dGTP pyrophosphatase MutT (NUDIX family)
MAAANLLGDRRTKIRRHQFEECERRIAFGRSLAHARQHPLERPRPLTIARSVGEKDQCRRHRPIIRTAVGESCRPARRALLPFPTLPTFAMSLPVFRLSPDAQRDWLIERLARPAPTSATGMSDGWRLPGREGVVTPAAVLVALVNRDAGLQVLLTQRSDSLPDHPGQISFPGGRIEPGDPSITAAALREAQEEVGLPPERVAVLGHLAPYETVTGYRVSPVVAWIEPPFPLTPDPVEVADVFEVPLAFLLDPANQQRHFRMIGTHRRDYWAIPYRERYIWGATAAMLMILDRTLRNG